MKKFFLLFLSIYLFALPAFAQLEMNLSSNRGILMSREFPVVYKPSKLIIGQENIIKVKAEPNSMVELMISSSNSGAIEHYGHKLRLGSEFMTIKGVIPENGLLELKFSLPDKKDLAGKSAYFEVAVFKSDNLQEARFAKIMDDDCRETSSNEVSLALPPQDVSRPSLSPMVPLIPPEFLRAIDTAEKVKNGKEDKEEVYNEYMNENPYQTPAYIRNLKAPELMNPPLKQD